MLWTSTCRSTDCGAADNKFMATLIDTFLNQKVVTNCNFSTAATCKILPVVIVNNTSVPGGTKSYRGEVWQSIGKNSGTAYECELLHEMAHIGLADNLCNEYDADYAGPGQNCYGVYPEAAGGGSACINLINGRPNSNFPPMNPVTKWHSYVATYPYEGGGHCNDDVWRPSSATIMRGANISCDFDELGIEALNKGIGKRLGDIADTTGPIMPPCTIGGAPVQGQTIKNTVKVECSPTDASGIAFVEASIACQGGRHYYLGFKTIADKGNYVFDLNSIKHPDGKCFLHITAYDRFWNIKNYNPWFIISNGKDL